jgi:SAM-dependent methyltransferase
MATGLRAIIDRDFPPDPWAGDAKIPWHEPGFSERMLPEHLSQAHDAASRRLETVDAQVRWIHEVLLGGESGRVLDLGCGPGLYATRLARLGHTVHGIDFSPASIRYARAECEGQQLPASFALADIRSADYGSGYDCAMLLYGELNAFKRDDGLLILTRIRQSLRNGGRVLLEPHTFGSLQSSDGPTSSWRTLHGGLFSDRPHLLLEESFWDAARSVRIHRWFVVDVETGEVDQHLESMQAYSDAGYQELLEEAGFRDVVARPDWPAAPAHEGTLTALIART